MEAELLLVSDGVRDAVDCDPLEARRDADFNCDESALSRCALLEDTVLAPLTQSLLRVVLPSLACNAPLTCILFGKSIDAEARGDLLKLVNDRVMEAIVSCPEGLEGPPLMDDTNIL